MIDAENGGIDEELFQYIIEVNEQTPFHRFLNMNINYLESGLASMEMEVKEDHTNPAGIAHGGIAFSLLDTAMSMSARTVGKEITTIEMNINYLRPAKLEDRVKAVGSVVKAGRKIMVCEGELYSPQDKMIAKARETFYVTSEIE